MNKQQKQLIKDLYKSADYEQKEKIKQAFPEALGLPETGWLMNKYGVFVYRIGKDKGYGFNGDGRWIKYPNYISFNFESDPQYWQPATEEEVKEMLITEAKRRGVWDCPIIDVEGDKLEEGMIEYYEMFSIETNQLWSRYGLVFDNGKWATPIAQCKTETIHLFGNTYKISLVN